MKARKAAAIEAGKEQPPAKRRKLGHQHNNNKSESLMDSLNDDCLISIFSNLSVDDLNNSIAMCNRRFRDARGSDSLDQTRTGTIILSEGSTVRSLFEVIVENNWKEIFSGNRKKLRLVGFHHLRHEESPSLPAALVESAQLPGVIVLDASISTIPDYEVSFIRSNASPLFCIFPNLRELDMSHVFLSAKTTDAIRPNCPALFSITWNSDGSNDQPHCGERFRGLNYLRELCLDGFLFRPDEQSPRYLFERCPSIERLSIKDCAFDGHDGEEGSELPQERLIQMVRNHPSLRWLRSDLSAENVAMLQQERPEITFASD